MYWNDQLEAILSEGVDRARQRERSAFDEAAGPSAQSIVLYGAGNLGRKVLRGLRANGLEPLAFADGNPALAGGQVEGIPVFSPSEAAQRFGQSAVFVVCVWHPNREQGVQYISERLRALGARRVAPFVWLFWKYPETFLPYYLWDLPSKLMPEAKAVVEACGMLADDESRTLFVRQLQLRSQAQFSCLPQPAPEPAYFAHDLFAWREDEYFIDCGAYDGDTVRDLVQHSNGHFRRIVAFEPDPSNFKLLQSLVESDRSLCTRTVLHQAALGDTATTVRIEATGQANAAVSSAGDVEVECMRLDDVLAGETPTFVKMDIEGAEPAALAGGRKVIESQQPILAICVYHLQDHLWTLPLFMRQLEPDASLQLRMYYNDGFDLVCFAVPPNRSRGTRN